MYHGMRTFFFYFAYIFDHISINYISFIT